MSPTKAPNATELLAAYDAQLRLEAEVRSAKWVRAFPPVLLAAFADRGYVTYNSLASLALVELDQLVAAVAAAFRDGTDVTAVEWKTRGHDLPPELPEILVHHGFAAEPQETILAGPVGRLARKVDPPEGVTIRRAGVDSDLASDVRSAVRAQQVAFADVPAETTSAGDEAWIEDLTRQLEGRQQGLELWLAEADGKVIASGRIDFVDGTDFAGLWGGGVVPEWRGRGVYRALTSARARAAKTLGATLIYCDATAASGRVLGRAGLVPITTTTPYVWSRTPG